MAWRRAQWCRGPYNPGDAAAGPRAGRNPFTAEGRAHDHQVRIEEAVKNGAYLCGPPSQLIETLMRLEQEYPGLERVSVSHPMGVPEPLMLEQLEWFAAEVMLVFTRR